MVQPKFEVIFLDEAMRFLEDLDEQTRDKILYNIDKASYKNDPRLFKKLRDDIWEFRTFYFGNQYRLLAFWSKTNNSASLVFATHGIVKKMDKMPDKEINKSIEIRRKFLLQ